MTAGIGAACLPLIGGVNDKLILINYDDLLSVTVDSDFTASNVFSSMTLKSGKQGYLFEGKGNRSIAFRQNPIVDTYGSVSGWTHEIDFVGFADSPEANDVLERLAQSKTIAVLESNKKFWVLGYDSGFFASSIATDSANADTKGGGAVTLIAKSEPRLKYELGVYTGTVPDLVYDYTASKALFEGLLVATV